MVTSFSYFPRMRYSNRKQIGFLAVLSKSFKERLESKFGCIDVVVAFVVVIVAVIVVVIVAVIVVVIVAVVVVEVVVTAVGEGIKAELKNRF